MMYRTEATDRFEVIDDAGRIHFIDEYTKFRKVTLVRGPDRWVAGARSLMLGNRHVNHIDDDTFELLDTAERLRRLR